MHTDAIALGFPLLAAGGLVAVAGGLALLGAVVARQWGLALTVLGLGAVGTAGYAVTLAALSLASRDTVLAPGTEKHICEIDCHLAYAVTAVRTSVPPAAPTGEVGPRRRTWSVRLRVRFDPATMGPRRPLDAPVRGGPRTVVVVDARGRRYAPTRTAGGSATSRGDSCLAEGHPLLPGASCSTTLLFDLPEAATAPRLLVANAAPEAALIIGHEMSLGHRRTYFALRPDPPGAER